MFTVQLPTPRAKKRHTESGKLFPFPIISNSSLVCSVGILKPDCVEVPNFQDELHRRGYFGEIVLSHKPGNENSDKNQEENWERPQGQQQQREDVPPVRTLILTFEEAFFLCYALGSLVVKDGEHMLNIEQLWQRLLQLNSVTREGETPFPALYAAYHHFRSKGWVVKSGISFGANYVLYKDGPPFYHATYSVRVLCGHQTSAAPSWALLATLNRATVNAGKNVLLCYVLTPECADFSLPTCVKQFQVQEMLLRRWVGATERSE